MSGKAPKPANELGYAEALAELEAILEELEDDHVDVDRLTDRVTRARELITRCRERIADARLKIDDVVADLD
jgi:exodeoxyribonuclease VII small subunit